LNSTLSTVGLIEVVAVVFIASSMQTILGFGFGMIAIPLLLTIGIPLPEAILLVTGCSFLQTTNAASHFRHDIDMKLAFKASFVRILFMPVGVFCLFFLESSDPSLSKRWAGMAILFMLGLGSIPSKRLAFLRSNSFAYFSWAASGFMGTSMGVGGPPLIVWAKIQKWAPEKTRAFTLNVLLLSMLPALATLFYRFPEAAPPTLKRILLCLPAVWIGLKVGKILSKKLPTKILENLILGLLLIASIKLIIGI